MCAKKIQNSVSIQMYNITKTIIKVKRNSFYKYTNKIVCRENQNKIYCFIQMYNKGFVSKALFLK